MDSGLLDDPSAPTPFLFHLSGALAPWIILGFQIRGAGILYLSFLILLLDFRFWFGVLNEAQPRQFWWLVWSSMVFVFVYSLRAANPAGYSWNILMGVMTAFYHYRGFVRWGAKGVIFGTAAACLYAVAQAIDASVFGTTYLSPRNFIKVLSQQVTFGIGGLDGYAYARSDFLPQVTRVSGTATEPGFFCLVLCAITPIVMRTPWALALVIAGLISSLSTVTMVLVPAGIGLWFLSRRLRPPFLLLLSVALFSYLAFASLRVKQLGSLAALQALSDRWYLRLWGAFGFQDLAPVWQFFGTGKNRVCEYVSNDLILSAWFGNGFADYINQQSCILATQSGLGSMLVDIGIFGVILWALFFAAYELATLKVSINPTTLMRRTLGPNPYGVYLLWFVLSFLSIHFLTFYPSHYVLLGWIFAGIKNQSDTAVATLATT